MRRQRVRLLIPISWDAVFRLIEGMFSVAKMVIKLMEKVSV